MNAVLIPVRSVSGAKNRLGNELDEAARERLTLAMLADMISAARAARRADRVCVVSGDRAVLDFARAAGAEALEESSLPVFGTRQDPLPNVLPRGGLNRAVCSAARALATDRVRRLLTIPGDVPLVTAFEIDALFDAGRPAVVLVRSGPGSGTNGLLTSPPDVITPVFEGASLAAHAAACDTAGVGYEILALPGFALDIDTVDDLCALATSGRHTGSGRVASELLAGLTSQAATVTRNSFASASPRGTSG